MSHNLLQPLTPVVFHVLLALNDGPAHGYAVMRAVAESAVGEPIMGPSTVYGALERLSRPDLVGVSKADKSQRKRYTLTPAGHQALWAEAARIARLAELVQARQLVPKEGN